MKRMLFIFCVFILAACKAKNTLPNEDDFVVIPAGSYTLGSPQKERGRNPKGIEDIRTVELDAFYISPYEITESQYYSMMNPNFPYDKTENYPVVNVSWEDAISYCNERSRKEGLEAAYSISTDTNGKVQVEWDRNANGYRLPTIDEWEAACRAGTSSKFYTGKRVTKRQANFMSDGRMPVGQFKPNKFGLYDMMGNIAEWCWKWDDYDFCFHKGGSWIDNENLLRSSAVVFTDNTHKKDYLGFRIVRNIQ